MSDGEDEQSNARDVCPVRCQRSVNVCGRIGYRRAPPVLQPRAGDTASRLTGFTGHSWLIRSRDCQVHPWPFSESAHYPVSRGRKKSHFETRLLVRNMRARRSPDPPGGRSLGVSCTQSGGSACITAGSQEKVNWNGFSLRLRASRDVIRKVGNSDAMGVERACVHGTGGRGGKSTKQMRSLSLMGAKAAPDRGRDWPSGWGNQGRARLYLPMPLQPRQNYHRCMTEVKGSRRERRGVLSSPGMLGRLTAGTSAAMAILI